MGAPPSVRSQRATRAFWAKGFDFTAGLTTLLICRIMLGAGEGPAFSVPVHALFKWFPDAKLTLPAAIVCQGSALGGILAVPTLNWIIINYSWHWAFGTLGVVGIYGRWAG